MNRLKEIELWLMDMDGTIYYEDELISGALEFFDLLCSQNKKYAFMTNNSSKGRTEYVNKLVRLGIPATESQIASSVNATIRWLKSWKSGARLYLVGTESLKCELETEGFDIVPTEYRGRDVDCVLLGFDTELTYSKLRGLVYYVSQGCRYIATNCDLRCPIKGGYIPDCGAIANMIEITTGRKPLFLGKPDRAMVDAVAEEWGIPVEKVACVGDRLGTDIQVGINAGCLSICVLTGEATQSEIEKSSSKPDLVFTSIKELYEALK